MKNFQNKNKKIKEIIIKLMKLFIMMKLKAL